MCTGPGRQANLQHSILQDCSDRPCGTAVTGGQETRATATYSAWLTKYLRMGKGSSTACAELSTHTGSFGTTGHGDPSIPVAWCMGEQAHHGPHLSQEYEHRRDWTRDTALKNPTEVQGIPPWLSLQSSLLRLMALRSRKQREDLAAHGL